MLTVPSARSRTPGELLTFTSRLRADSLAVTLYIYNLFVPSVRVFSFVPQKTSQHSNSTGTHACSGRIDPDLFDLCCECSVCGVVWCGVVWCGVVWCGVVWCGVVFCAGATYFRLSAGSSAETSISSSESPQSRRSSATTASFSTGWNEHVETTSRPARRARAQTTARTKSTRAPQQHEQKVRVDDLRLPQVLLFYHMLSEQAIYFQKANGP
jgi:hypothetical protein